MTVSWRRPRDRFCIVVAGELREESLPLDGDRGALRLSRWGEHESDARLMRAGPARRYRRSVTILGRRFPAGRSRSGSVDLLIAAVVGVALVANTWISDADPLPTVAGTALSAGIAGALWVRRRLPVIAGVGVGGLVSLHGFVVEEAGTVPIVPLLIAFYSVGAYAARPRALIGFVLAYGATVLGLFGDPNVSGNIPENAFFVLLITGATWVSGMAVRTSRARSATLADLAAQLEQERDANARLAVAAERGRIARELHDVVAHGISVIAVQAGAGRHALGNDSQRAHAAFAAIEDTARQALVEMRRMLGLLREGAAPATSAPLPGLSDFDDLIERARADNLAVDVGVEGNPRSLPPGVDLAAYRILQEALTNVRKHAPETRAEVRIRYATGDLEIDVRNDGALGPLSPGDESGGGHGLIGMRERVALYGGTLEAGPLADGGFRVRARVPLDGDRP